VTRIWGQFLTGAALALGLSGPALALDDLRLTAPDPVLELLRAASLTETARREGRTDPQDLFAAARSDYARLLAALYAEGYYSGVISIRIDGREAASIPPLEAPARIRRIEIAVQPGPVFQLGRARVAPLAPGTRLPEGFVTGQTARAGTLRAAAEAGVSGWRAAGHAKAAVGQQSLIADHARAVLEAEIGLAPGPLVRLGQLRFAGETAVRPDRLAAIAGFRSGRIYSPTEMRKIADRLRRTGVFQAVSLAEAETLGPGDTLDVTATLADLPPRRIGGGLEFSSSEGLTLSGFWMHRNLWGGAERLRIEGKIARIGGSPLGLELGATLDRPATFTPDTDLTLSAKVERLRAGALSLDVARLGAGLSHRFNDRLTGSAGVEYSYARLNLNGSSVDFQHLSLPLALTLDARDDKLDPRRGFYLSGEARPFIGFGSTGDGARLSVDARAYRGLGERFVLAGRLQGGVVLGAGLAETPAQYRFYSGGGGTVRGHAFQSLGVDTLGYRSGGNLFLGASVEARVKFTDKIGAVAFYDMGLIEDMGAPVGNNWHGGAGLGLRYATGIGAIRLDVGLPVGGRPGSGMQLYIGIGQAF
jgi:translocation and assembly module TamA